MPRNTWSEGDKEKLKVAFKTIPKGTKQVWKYISDNFFMGKFSNKAICNQANRLNLKIPDGSKDTDETSSDCSLDEDELKRKLDRAKERRLTKLKDQGQRPFKIKTKKGILVLVNRIQNCRVDFTVVRNHGCIHIKKTFQPPKLETIEVERFGIGETNNSKRKRKFKRELASALQAHSLGVTLLEYTVQLPLHVRVDRFQPVKLKGFKGIYFPKEDYKPHESVHFGSDDEDADVENFSDSDEGNAENNFKNTKNGKRARIEGSDCNPEGE